MDTYICIYLYFGNIRLCFGDFIVILLIKYSCMVYMLQP